MATGGMAGYPELRCQQTPRRAQQEESRILMLSTLNRIQEECQPCDDAGNDEDGACGEDQ